MSDHVLAADAAAVAQVRQAEITAYDAATTYSVTINGKTISTLGTGGTVSTTATALVALLNAATAPPEFLEVSWSTNAGIVIGTMDTDGKPFDCTSDASGGTGTMDAFADTTANSGPNVLIAANVKDVSDDSRALPGAADTLTLESLAVDLLYALDALSGVTLAALNIEASFTGRAALQPVDEDGATD